jgi:hypothetical protein
MRQPNGLGTNVEWHDPEETVSSLTGFKRYFTWENYTCKQLYNLSTNLPESWKRIPGKIRRRDREQTVAGATMSALFAAAFNIQAQVMRAAGNHKIQSTGAILTKKLQRRLWDLQPSGIHPWHIQPMNIHDEIMAPCILKLHGQVSTIIQEFVEEHRSLIPLLGIDWKNDMSSWASK